MRPIRPIAAGLCLALAAAIGARASEPVPPPGQFRVAVAPGCAFVAHSGRVRQGDNIPVGVHLRSTGQWCFAQFTLTGNSLKGTHIVAPPNHGDLWVIVRSPTMVVGYRPAPGYVGGDRFLIGLPGDIGVDTHYSATVTVDK